MIQSFSPDGIPLKFNYLPSLKDIKTELDELASKLAAPIQRDARIQAQLKERAEFEAHMTAYPLRSNQKGDYTGPIEDVRPGDILTHERQIEYRQFMAKKHNMKNIKLWSDGETYKDSGARPFAVNLPDDPPKEEPNPFE